MRISAKKRMSFNNILDRNAGRSQIVRQQRLAPGQWRGLVMQNRQSNIRVMQQGVGLAPDIPGNGNVAREKLARCP